MALRHLDEQVAQIDLSAAVYDLPNPTAATVADVVENVEQVIAWLSDPAPGHTIGLHLDLIPPAALLSLIAVLKKVATAV